MGALPENSSYNSSSGNLANTTAKISTRPISRLYSNLSELRRQGGNLFKTGEGVQPTGTPEYYQGINEAVVKNYGQHVNIPTEQQFMPPADSGAPTDNHTPIPVPSDYSGFAEGGQAPGSSYKWETPQKPEIMNLPGDTPGQYVRDSSNPDALIKSKRGYSPIQNDAILNGRPSSLYQIDHIIPLALGGADTMANRQVLTMQQNDKKTRAQAIPYTLYSNGIISLNEARSMAMQWKDRDLTDVPQPDNVGLVPLDIAKKTVAIWNQPKKVGIKDFFAAVPEAAKNLGKGKLPDPIREFVKGVASGASFGLVPYEQGENQGTGSKVAGIVGNLAGGIASWTLGGALIDGALGVAGLGRAAYLGATSAKEVSAAKAAYEAISAGKGAANIGAKTGNILTDAVQGAKYAMGGPEALNPAFNLSGRAFSSIQKAPTYLTALLGKNLMPKTLAFGGRMAVQSAVVGELNRQVAQKYNASVLGGLEAPQENQHTIMNSIFTDVVFGAASGWLPPGTKNTLLMGSVPATIQYISNPNDPVGALVTGVMMGVGHHTSGKVGTEEFAKVQQEFKNTADSMAYATLRNYVPSLPEHTPGVGVHSIIPSKIGTGKIFNIDGLTDKGKMTGVKNVIKFEDVGGKPSVSKYVVDENGYETMVDSRTVSSAQKAYQTKDPQLLAQRFANPGVDYNVSAAAYKTPVQDTRYILQDAESINKITKDATDSLWVKYHTDGLSLEELTTELKRISIAGRQLYLGTLDDLRAQGERVNDALSNVKMTKKDPATGKSRFDEHENFTKPPATAKAFELLDPKFETTSIKQTGPNSGKYVTGDTALRGAGLDSNSPNVRTFFEAKAKGNANPNILLTLRSEADVLGKKKNILIAEKNPEMMKRVNAGTNAVDPAPENAIQAWGQIRDPKTGEKTLLELGWITSEHGLNGKGNPYAINNGMDAGSQPGSPYSVLTLHKDQIAPAMRKEGVDFLWAELDELRSTTSTKRSGRPFVVVKLGDANWEAGKMSHSKVSTSGAETSLQANIAKVNSAVSAQERQKTITKIKEQVKSPASTMLPPVAENADPHLSIAHSSAKTLLENFEECLSSKTVEEIKTSFQGKLGIKLENDVAQNLLNNKNHLGVRDELKILTDAYNTGNMGAEAQAMTRFADIYFKSGVFNASKIAKAFPALKATGGIDIPQKKTLGAPPDFLKTGAQLAEAKKAPVTPVAVENPQVRQVAAPVVSELPKATQVPKTPHTKVSKTVTLPMEPEQQAAWDKSGKTKSTTPASPLKPQSLAQRIVNGANNHGKAAKKNQLVEAADNMYYRAKSIIEDYEISGRGGVHKSINEDTGAYAPESGGGLKFAKKAVAVVDTIRPEGKNISSDEIVFLKDTIRNRLEGDIVLQLQDKFGMPLEDAENVVRMVSDPIGSKIQKISEEYPNAARAAEENLDTVSLSPEEKRAYDNILRSKEIKTKTDKALETRSNSLNYKQEAIDAQKLKDQANKELSEKLFKEGIIDEKEAAELAQPAFFKKAPITGVSKWDTLARGRKVATQDLFRWIKTSKTKPAGTYYHAFGETLERGLELMFGSDYKKDRTALGQIGRAVGNEGIAQKEWSRLAETVDPTRNFEEFTQPKDYMEARAQGNRSAKKIAESARKAALEADAENPQKTLTPSDMKTLGVQPEEAGGLSIHRDVQVDGMVGLSRGDMQFLPGLTTIETGGAPSTGKIAVRKGVEDARNVMQTIAKNHNAAIRNNSSGDFVSITGAEPISGRDYAKLTEEQKNKLYEETDQFFNNIAEEYVKKYNVTDRKISEVGSVEKPANTVKFNTELLKSLKKVEPLLDKKVNIDTPEDLATYEKLKSRYSGLIEALEKNPSDANINKKLDDLVSGLEKYLAPVDDIEQTNDIMFGREDIPDAKGGPGWPTNTWNGLKASVAKYGSDLSSTAKTAKPIDWVDAVIPGTEKAINMFKNLRNKNQNTFQPSTSPIHIQPKPGEVYQNLVKKEPLPWEAKNPGKKYNIRGVKTTDDELAKITPYIWAEISSRNDGENYDKADLETRVVINSMINRIKAGKGYGSDGTLYGTLSAPNQYQSFATTMLDENGKVVSTQYAKLLEQVKNGTIDAKNKKKLETVLKVMEAIKAEGENFKDTTNGATFYSHAPDRSIWFGNNQVEVGNAINNRMGKRINLSQSAGLPVSTPQ